MKPKLVHGGVRYLEKAVFQLDPGQLKLVFEALRERKTLLNNGADAGSPSRLRVISGGRCRIIGRE